MRHRKNFNHLSRKRPHRKAMLANMASSLILHKRIHTTVAKAKALRSYIEPLITKSKDDTTHSRRVVFSYLQSKEAVSELFREVSVKAADRPGGYTRIIKIGNRLGDNADMCMMELVDFNENLLTDKQAKAKTSRRRRGAGKKKTEDQVVAGTAAVAATTDVAEGTDADQVAETTVEEKVQEIETEITTEVETITETKDVLEEEVKEQKEEPTAESKEIVEDRKQEHQEEEKPEAKIEDEKPEEEKEDDTKKESK